MNSPRHHPVLVSPRVFRDVFPVANDRHQTLEVLPAKSSVIDVALVGAAVSYLNRTVQRSRLSFRTVSFSTLANEIPMRHNARGCIVSLAA